MIQVRGREYPQGKGQSGDIVHTHPANIHKNRAELGRYNLAPHIDFTEQRAETLQKPFTTREFKKGDTVTRVFEGERYATNIKGQRAMPPRNESIGSRKQRQRMRANKLYDAQLKDVDD